MKVESGSTEAGPAVQVVTQLTLNATGEEVHLAVRHREITVGARKVQLVRSRAGSTRPKLVVKGKAELRRYFAATFIQNVLV